MSAPKGNGLDAANDQPAKTDTKNKSDLNCFTGTDNPRELRAIHALMKRPITREHLDQVAGCSNSPDLISALRRKGLKVPCTRTKKKDRDLFVTFPGVYYFTPTDRRRVLVWIAKRDGGAHA